MDNVPAIDLNSDAFNSEEYERLRGEHLRTGLPDFKILDGFIYKRMDL